MLHRRGQSLVDVREVVEATIYKHHVGLVILDSISRAGAGDLTENKSVNVIIDILNGFGVPWLGLAHSPRASDAHVFGGIHFDAGADIVVRLTSEERERKLGVGLQITKANDTAKGGMSVYNLEFDEDGLSGFSAASEKDFPQLRADKMKGMAESIRDYLLDNENVGATGTQLASALNYNRVNVASVLAHDPQFVKDHKEGKDTFYRVAEE